MADKQASPRVYSSVFDRFFGKTPDRIISNTINAPALEQQSSERTTASNTNHPSHSIQTATNNIPGNNSNPGALLSPTYTNTSNRVIEQPLSPSLNVRPVPAASTAVPDAAAITAKLREMLGDHVISGASSARKQGRERASADLSKLVSTLKRDPVEIGAKRIPTVR